MYDYSCLNLLMKTIVNISLYGFCFMFPTAECIFPTAERTFRNGERMFRSAEHRLNTLSLYIQTVYRGSFTLSIMK